MILDSAVEAVAHRSGERQPLDSARGPELVERASRFRRNCGIQDHRKIAVPAEHGTGNLPAVLSSVALAKEEAPGRRPVLPLVSMTQTWRDAHATPGKRQFQDAFISLGFGTWSLALGVWSLGFGVWPFQTGIGCPSTSPRDILGALSLSKRLGTLALSRGSRSQL